MRIGIGYDAHRFQSDRPLILGGIVIPYHYGLSGHSDADVLTHSIIDALLGALNLGDIGTWFPDTDEKYRNTNSLNLLKVTYQKIIESGYVLVNSDSVVIAQEPKLKEYFPLICSKLSTVLNTKKNDISVKATTTEGLGFEGRKEGIVAQTICLLRKNDAF